MRRVVIVTGGCGFIGSHFVRTLHVERPSWHVINLDKLTYAGNVANVADVPLGDHYRFVTGDICDAPFLDELIGEARPWAVVNFAAESHVDRSILDSSPFLRTNVLGVQVLLDAVRRHRVQRFVQISTDEVYGDLDAPAAADEEAPLRPSSPYAASKAAADHLCLSYGRTYGTPVMIVRSANNYGPFQYPEKLVPLVIRNAVKGETIPVYGDGGQVRDWLHVADNCAAILRVLEHGEHGGVYNVGADNNRSNLQTVQMLCELIAAETGQSSETIRALVRFVPDRPGHDRRYALDTKRVRTQLGWAPQVDPDEGLLATVRWYLAHPAWLESATTGGYRDYYIAVYHRGWATR